jgi:hypothetical protein
MDWFKKAVAAGFREVNQLKKDKDPDALFQREDYKRLVAELEAASMDHLRLKAIAAGDKNVAQIKKDIDIDAVRGHVCKRLGDATQKGSLKDCDNPLS